MPFLAQQKAKSKNAAPVFDSISGSSGHSARQAAADSSPRVQAMAQLSQSLNNGPKPRAMAVMRQVANRSRNAASPVIQRYTITAEGRLSENGRVLQAAEGALYAAAEQFHQANGIGGDVEFIPGAARRVGDKDLSRVLPRVKRNSLLDRELTQYDRADDREQAQGITRRRFPADEDDLKPGFFEAVQPIWEEMKESDPDRAEREFGTLDEEELEQITDRWAAFAYQFLVGSGATYERSGVAADFERYLQQSSDRADIPEMPSDCLAMATRIAGFDIGSGVETDEIAPGNVYEYQSTNKQSEWPFHYATIVMTDGADHVTMENAAAKASELFTKLTFDRGWYFGMYGSGHGQTFEDKYRPDMEPPRQLKAAPAAAGIVQRAVETTAVENDSIPVKGRMDRRFRWQATGEHETGFIVQKIERSESTTVGEETTESQTVYWEAWRAQNGRIYNGNQELNAGSHDTWFQTEAPAGSYGASTIRGTVYFTSAGDLPGMASGTVGAAGTLLSSLEAPDVPLHQLFEHSYTFNFDRRLQGDNIDSIIRQELLSLKEEDALDEIDWQTVAEDVNAYDPSGQLSAAQVEERGLQILSSDPAFQ